MKRRKTFWDPHGAGPSHKGQSQILTGNCMRAVYSVEANYFLCDRPCTADLGRAGYPLPRWSWEPFHRTRLRGQQQDRRLTVVHSKTRHADRHTLATRPTHAGGPMGGLRPGIGPVVITADLGDWRSRRILVPSGPGLACSQEGFQLVKTSGFAVGEMPGTFWIGASRGIA